ncbi:MAG: helix-turn-helix transcriptional regulator [Victivallaceae bacterium]|nr:helix-turn-helix transcriptional regulator [Victivallaceae bacterium]
MDYFDGLSFTMAGTAKRITEIKTNFPRYYGIQFFHACKLYVRTDRKKVFRGQGSFAFLTYPLHRFDYGIYAGEGTHCWLCCCGPRMERYIETGLFEINPNNLPVKFRHPEKFFQSIQELINMVDTVHYHNSYNRMVMRLEDLLLQLHEQNMTEKKIPTYHNRFFEDLLSRINSLPEKKWDFDLEAERIHVTRNHFNRLFKDFSGTSPQRFLIQCRLAKAAELLLKSSRTVYDIASEAGIENEFYFSRLFKSRYHVSPREYRRELLGR